MARPLPILKSRTYLVGRRCSQRKFLLRPEKLINEGFKFVLAEAARCHGVLLYAVVVMSNHYHLVVRDTRGALPAFLHQLNSATGHAFNVLRRRRENFWSTRRTRSTHLVDLEAIIAMVVYTLINPVKAGLVDRAIHWPGVSSYSWLDGRTIEARRPHFYFDREGQVPETASLSLSVPHEFQGGADAWADLIRQRVADEEERLAEARRARGHGVRGRKAVLADATSRCGVEEEDLRERTGYVSASCPEVAKAAVAALKAFWSSYKIAVEELRQGLRTTLFPAGTWMLARQYGVKIAPA